MDICFLFFNHLGTKVILCWNGLLISGSYSNHFWSYSHFLSTLHSPNFSLSGSFSALYSLKVSSSFIPFGKGTISPFFCTISKEHVCITSKDLLVAEYLNWEALWGLQITLVDPSTHTARPFTLTPVMTRKKAGPCLLCLDVVFMGLRDGKQP